MSKRMNGKVAVITGGASGMGRQTALTFLAQGARVLIADINQSMAEETLSLAAEAGHGADIRFKHTDVSSEPQVIAMIDEAVSAFGRLDCLFNNAGVGGTMASITETAIEDWDWVHAMVTRSVFLGMKHGGRALQRQGQGGSIINTASTAGLGGGCGPAAYSAAKAGVVSITKSGAIEFAPHRIRVNAICPGWILTPLIPAESGEEMLTFTRGRQPLPDAGKPSDIANAALFLASDESRFCTGTTTIMDGGLLAWGPGLFPGNAISG